MIPFFVTRLTWNLKTCIGSIRMTYDSSWKHPIEIEKFISRIDEEIAMMNVYKRRVAETGN